jgi:hypothetical protein
MVELLMTYAKKASQKKTSEKSKQHWIRKKSKQLYLIAKRVAGVDENLVSEDDLTSREVVEHIVWQRLGGIVIWDKETMLDVEDCIMLRDLSSTIPLSTRRNEEDGIDDETSDDERGKEMGCEDVEIDIPEGYFLADGNMLLPNEIWELYNFLTSASLPN